MFSGDEFDFDGDFFTLRGAVGRPRPHADRVPIHLGGAGEQLTGGHCARRDEVVADDLDLHRDINGPGRRSRAADADRRLSPQAAAGGQEGLESLTGTQLRARVELADAVAHLSRQALRLHAQVIVERCGQRILGAGESGQEPEQRAEPGES